MKTKQTLVELNESEMRLVNGGDFAYDFGFAIRELGVYVINGANFFGTAAVCTDIVTNYRPQH